MALIQWLKGLFSNKEKAASQDKDKQSHTHSNECHDKSVSSKQQRKDCKTQEVSAESKKKDSVETPKNGTVESKQSSTAGSNKSTNAVAKQKSIQSTPTTKPALLPKESTIPAGNAKAFYVDCFNDSTGNKQSETSNDKKEVAENKQNLNNDDNYSKLLKELAQIMNLDAKTSQDPQKILKELREKLSNLQKRGQELAQIRKEKQNLESQNNVLSVNLKKTEKDAESKVNSLKAECEKKIQKISQEVDVWKSKYETVSKSDAGILKTQLDETRSNLDTVNEQISNARKEIDTKDGIIKDKNSEIEKLTTEQKNLNAKFEASKKQVKELTDSDRDKQRVIDKNNKTISDLNTEVQHVKEVLSTKEAECQRISDELKSANHTITSLKSDVGARDYKIKNLEAETVRLEAVNAKHVSTMSEDISSLTDSYIQAAETLVDAVKENFLSECNPDTETDTVESMCAKIRKGVQMVANAVKELKSKDYANVNELREEYERLIKDSVESYAFMEIARWWAYSRLPFIADRARDEGRAVSLSEVNNAYQALSRMLALAGYSYQQPALFVENLDEGSYNDCTGREQLNLEYQYPNVRAHVDKIDRQDRTATVIDIVKLGYYHNGKLVKTSEVIL